MEINKISLGVETLDTPSVVGITVKPKLARLKFLLISVFEKSVKVLGKILSGVGKAASGIKNFILHLSIPPVLNRLKGVISNTQPAMRDIKHNIGTPNKVKKTVFLLAGLIVLLIIVFTVKNNLNKANKSGASGSTLGQKTDLNAPLKTLAVNREFQFPVKDGKGKEVTKLKYFIDKAELRDEIIVKGQKATAVSGRVFLIIYLKATNEYSQKLDINTRNYVRLSLNGDENEWLAPDIHNDPVEVQAQSTKVTRLGFPINQNDTKLLLRIGEIDGDKEKVELNF